MLVADFNGIDLIRRFTVDGTATTGFEGVDGLVGSARAVEVGPDGLVYVAGADTGRVARYDPVDGSLVDVVVDVAVGADPSLVKPRGLAFDGDGNLLVSSAGTDEVVLFDRESGDRIAVVAADGLDNPGDLLVEDDGLLWVTSQGTDSIIGYRYDGDEGDNDGGEPVLEIATGPGSGPVDLAIAPDGRFLVAMADGGRVDAVTLPEVDSDDADDDLLIEEFVGSGLVTPTAVSIGPDGTVWVADHWLGSVRRFDLASGDDLGFVPDLDGGIGEQRTVDRTVDASFGPVDIAFLVTEPEPADTSDSGSEDDGSSRGERRAGPQARSAAWLRGLPGRAAELAIFPANGAADPGVDFGARGRSYDALFNSGAAYLLAEGVEPDDALVMTVVGGSESVAGITVDESPIAPGTDGEVDVPARKGLDGAEALSFDDVLPGVDLVYAAADGNLEYGFVVAPGTDPASIRLDFDGANGVTLRGNGDLLIESAVGVDFLSTAPYTFQRTGGGVVEVASAYTIEADGTVGFDVGDHDATLPLIIDPTFVTVDTAAGSYTSGSTIDLPVPATVATDDLMIAQIAYNATGGGIITPPAGWTLIDETGGNGVTQALYRRIATASEPASYSFTLSSGATDTAAGAITLYDGVDTTSPIDASAAQTNASAAAVVAPSVTTTVSGATLVAFYAVRDDGNGTAPAGMTERTDVNSAQGGAAADETLALSADEALGAAGATGSRTATVDVAAGSIGTLVALTPATGGGGASNLVMVTGTGDFTGNFDSTKKTLFESFGWTVTAVNGNNASALASAAAANDVMFVSDTSPTTIAYDLRDLDVGIVNEKFSAWNGFLYYGTQPQSYTTNTTIDIVDNSHYITSPFSTGTLTIYTSTDDINYWPHNSDPLPSGATVLADSPTSTNHVAFHVAETGGSLYSGNTAVNRRVWTPSDYSDPAVWNSNYDTLLERSLDWAAGNDAGGSVPVSPTVTVNSTGDSGDNNVGDDLCDTGGTNAEGDPECTLRAAIEEANASATVDTIRFIIPTTDSGHSSGIWTIQPGSGLPNVTSSTAIDATTQSGWTSSPVVVLDGTSTSGVSGLRFLTGAGNAKAAGLRIVHYGLDGVYIAPGVDAVTIVDNWIGSDGTGATAPGNTDDGIDTWGTNTVIERNVINHNGDEGIDIRGTGATITGNIVGLEADGSGGAGNDDVGIAVFADNTTIGGTSAAERNVISLNWEGIEINSNNNVVQGNYIGTASDGTTDRGNDTGDGIDLQSGTGNLIGGAGAGAGNVIAFNQLKGIDIVGGNDNAVLGNNIFSNGGLGIDLGTTGVTNNDANDADSGANDLLNFPVITSATETGGTVTVDYTLDVPAGNYRVEFFTNPSGADGSGYGEGQLLATSHSISHPGGGSQSFSTTYTGTSGDITTATATADLGGGSYGPTSEFSLASTATATGGSANLVMVTGTGDFSGGTDSAKKTLFESWGWTVTALDDDATAGAFSTAAAANDVMFISNTCANVQDKARDLNVGLVIENTSNWENNMFSATTEVAFTTATQISIVDNSHFITAGQSIGSLTIHTAADDVNYWQSNNLALPAGVQVLAESPTSTSHDALLIADTGATLYSANTAANRRVWFPSDYADPVNFTAAYQTLFERSLDWAAGLEWAIVDAVDDADTAVTNTATVVDVAGNDIDANGDAVTVIDATDPANGTATTNGDGTVTYTSDPAYTGADAFDYWAIDAGASLSHYWGLAGNGTDAVGSSNGTLTGTTTVAGGFGQALFFDEVDDRVTVPDFAYGSEFTVAFDLKIDNNTGSLFKYIYSHGNINSTDSINVFLLEGSHGTDPNKLRTVIRDGDDTLDNFALEFDASSIVGDGLWHTYTATVGTGGITVYLDGTEMASDPTRGTGGVNPSGSLYIGSRDDLNVDRYYGGNLDTVQVYDRALSSTEVADLASEVNVATVSMTVSSGTPPTFTVNSTGDGTDATPGDGQCDTGGTNSQGADECTLRAAIEEANALSGANVDFDIPTSEPGYSASPLSYTLTPASPYPFITEPTVLDATTQTGYAGDPVIELDGTGATGATGGLVIRSNDSTVRGFAVHSFVDEGLEIDGSTGFGDNNTVQNNWVGLDAAGTVQGNADHGILVSVDALDNLIGGTGAADGNVVAGNGSIGILVRTNSTDNTILGNSVYSNTGLGIDLDEDGVTSNDAGDPDTGSNDLLNFPTITSATESGGTVDVTFDLDVPVNPNGYRVEFFTNPSGADPSGNGEGEQFVSAVNVSPGTGLTHSFAGSNGDVVTATATVIDPGATSGFGPTSEFSVAATVGVQTAVPPTTVVFRNGNNGYTGTVDTWISSNVADQDNSAGLLLEIDDSPVQHGLIKFENIIGPGANQIPAGATIVSADLVFEASDPSAADASLSLYRVLRTWVETDTWNTLTSGISTDDVEARSTTDAVHTGGLDLTNTPITINGLEAAVQAWVDGDANQGWLLTLNRTNGWDAQSSENADVAGRPELQVTYVVGPVTHTVNSTGDGTDATPGDAICDTGGTNSAGDPECTLRAAIEESNAFSTVDIINFAMPATEAGHSGGVWTISPGSALPDLSDQVTIDGSTQPGWTTTPVVEINGTSAGGTTDGLRITADDVMVRSLAINRFGADGIELVSGAANAVIAGNHIGLDAGGTIDRGNGARGIDLGSGSGPTTVGGTAPADRNVISGNTSDGIIIFASDGNTIIGNYLGTDVTGNAPQPNDADGIAMGSTSANNTIGQAGSGNVLSGNGNDGFENDATGANNTVQANTIGLGVDGTTVVANGRYGVVIYNGANNTMIGGSGAGEGNVISGNTQSGVIIDGNSNPATTANTIAGNLIGTDATGSLDKGNGTYGIHFFAGANGNTIGGSTAAHGNVISGNGSGEGGVYITGTTTSGNIVRNNFVGVNETGTAAIANNLHGVWVNEAPNTQILDNLISGNDVHGVYIYGAGATGTQVLRNSIGTNAAESATIANGFDGIRLEGSSSGTVVGSPGNGNVVGGNADHGVNLNSSSGNTIQANHIGTNSGGSVDLGNTQAGVYSDAFNSSNNLIGGDGAGEGNTIAFNGVGVQLDTGDDNTILRNSLYSNTGLGLDLGGDGITANDSGDGDTGSNGLLNYPVVTSATEAAGTVTIDFDLDVSAGDYRVETFTNPSGADPSGNGEGETFESGTTVTHTGSGTESFQVTYSGFGRRCGHTDHH